MILVVRAAVRELLEETGIRIRREQLLYLGDYYLDVPSERTGAAWPFHFKQYMVNLPRRVSERDIRLSKDHTEAKFIDLELLRRVLFHPVPQFALPDLAFLRPATRLHYHFPINGGVPTAFRENLAVLLADPNAKLPFKPLPMGRGFSDRL